MVITETLQKSMQRVQEDIKKNAKEYRQQYDKKLGKMREMTVEEELALLDQDYRQMLSLKTFAMLSQMHAQETLNYFNKPAISAQCDREQMKTYIGDSGAAIKNYFLERYDKNPAQAVKDLKSIVMEILHKNNGMFEYCTALSAQLAYIGGDTDSKIYKFQAEWRRL